MKRMFQFGTKYEPAVKWLDETHDKEEINILLGKILLSYKNMKEKNIDLLILSDLLINYDLDIYKLIALLENNGVKSVSNEKTVREQSFLLEAEKKEDKTPKKTENPKTGILNLGINLSGEG